MLLTLGGLRLHSVVMQFYGSERVYRAMEKGILGGRTEGPSGLLHTVSLRVSVAASSLATSKEVVLSMPFFTTALARLRGVALV